jgi:hypothetical protein
MAISSQTTAALTTALASGAGNANEIINVLNGAQTGNQTITGTLAVTGATTLTGLLTANGGIANGSIQGALAALVGGGQAGATQLKIGMNKVITVTSLHDSVALPAATAGASVQVQNAGASGMDIYPLGASDVIQGLPVTVSMLVAAGTTLEFRCIVAGTWAIFSNCLLESSWSTDTTTGAFTAGELTGGANTTYVSTATTPGSRATRTAAQMINDFPNAQVGMTYFLTVINLSGSANTLTMTGGTGVTITGTATVAQNVARVYQGTFNSGTTLTLQEMYSFTPAA